MSDKNMTRRSGRDRRDAGGYRKAGSADRRRDVAWSQARELKARGLAWNAVGIAVSARYFLPAPLGFDEMPPFGPTETILSAEPSGATPLDQSVKAVAASAEVAASPADPSWLPEVGAPIVRDGVRIAAVEVAGGRAAPFYVLAAAG